MKWSRVMAVSRKVLRSLKHDRRTLGFLVLMPIFMIAIFGYTFGGDVHGVSIYIVDLDQGVGDLSLSQRIIAQLEGDDTLSIVRVITPLDDVVDPVAAGSEPVRDGEAWACLVFPSDFTQDVIDQASEVPYEGEPATIGLLLDGSAMNIAQAVLASVQSSMTRVMQQDLGFIAPVEVEREMVYGEGASFIDTFAPGVISLAVMMVTFMLSIISFIHERTAGTLARLLSTPVREGEVVAGYALAFGMVGLVQSIVVLTSALLLFGIQVQGPLLLVLLILFLLGVGMQGLGFLLSANARNEFQAVQFIPLIIFPSVLLSGVFWPIQAVPEVLRPLSYLLPLTYAVDGVRSTMLRGWGLEHVWPELVVLALFAMAMLALSVVLMRRRG
jgi:ABC-2 type transport system permease protein